MLQTRHYVGDVQPVPFTVEYDPADADQPWRVATDEGTNDTHHTLDQVLYWELVMGGRIISEAMRAQINRDFAGVAEAVAAERERCRREEVGPLMNVLKHTEAYGRLRQKIACALASVAKIQEQAPVLAEYSKFRFDDTVERQRIIREMVEPLRRMVDNLTHHFSPLVRDAASKALVEHAMDLCQTVSAKLVETPAEVQAAGEKPFKGSDVLFRWTPDDGYPRVAVLDRRCPCGVQLYWIDPTGQYWPAVSDGEFALEMSRRIEELKETNYNNVSIYQLQVEEQAKRIAELEAENKQLRACHESEFSVCQRHCDEVLSREALLAQYRTACEEVFDGGEHDTGCVCGDACKCYLSRVVAVLAAHDKLNKETIC